MENRRRRRKRHRSNTSKRLNNSLPRAEQEERKKTQLRRPRKDLHTHAGTTSEDVHSEKPTRPATTGNGISIG